MVPGSPPPRDLGPIVALSSNGTRVRDENDYSLRADVGGTTSLRAGDAFKPHARRDRSRDRLLARHRDHLAERVRVRTADLEQLNVQLRASMEKAKAATVPNRRSPREHEPRDPPPMNGVIGMTTLCSTPP